MVSLHKIYGSFFGTGPLLSLFWVLSAGQCGIYPNYDNFVRVGGKNVKDGMDIKIAEAFESRHYDGPLDNFVHDIQLIRLGQRVRSSFGSTPKTTFLSTSPSHGGLSTG